MRLLVLILVCSAWVLAEAQETLPPPSSAEPTMAAKSFTQEELDQLLAPIALYPDALLAQVLMASTYPLEVIEAHRWAQAHSYLVGDQLEDALQEQSWDPSVKGLVRVPQVLAMMDGKLDWTEKLGDAFLAQQQDVMDTVQRLRAKAHAAGNLASTPQQTVVTEGDVVTIQPAALEVIYVPVYDPAVIYGPWWWPTPPYYWYPPGYVPGPFIFFGFGFVVGPAIWGGCDWRHRVVVVNVHNYNTFNRTRITSPTWTHDVYHRRGVPYRDDAVRRQYREPLPGAAARRDFRGFEGAGTGYRLPPGAPAPHPAPSAGRRLAPTPLAPPQPPGAGQPISSAPPVMRQPGAGQRPPPAPSVLPQPPGAAQHTPAGPVYQPPAAPRAPPAFETFGRGDVARSYSDRGAASRGSPTQPPPAGAQGARPPAGGAQGARPLGARPPSR